eukprot:NODE_2361_length_1439_cov_227.822188_g2244_i0.p1 GENE.NODE_2361_length_1439_cov_227.822188_g2244_i0~~NODE_2361_length_1439_cov_227.822188_g2244_i0.p1  ORF type:complete len:369 (+),score=79.28 NODE_2361_length_1439_cov_227.822188_g2244_i0:153-1259(+)
MSKALVCVLALLCWSGMAENCHGTEVGTCTMLNTDQCPNYYSTNPQDGQHYNCAVSAGSCFPDTTAACTSSNGTKACPATRVENCIAIDKQSDCHGYMVVPKNDQGVTAGPHVCLWSDFLKSCQFETNLCKSSDDGMCHGVLVGTCTALDAAQCAGHYATNPQNGLSYNCLASNDGCFPDLTSACKASNRTMACPSSKVVSCLAIKDQTTCQYSYATAPPNNQGIKPGPHACTWAGSMKQCDFVPNLCDAPTNGGACVGTLTDTCTELSAAQCPGHYATNPEDNLSYNCLVSDDACFPDTSTPCKASNATSPCPGSKVMSCFALQEGTCAGAYEVVPPNNQGISAGPHACTWSGFLKQCQFTNSLCNP